MVSRGAACLGDMGAKEGMPDQTSGSKTRWYRVIQLSLGKRAASA